MRDRNTKMKGARNRNKRRQGETETIQKKLEYS